MPTVLGTRLTGRISNSRLYEKCGSIPLSRAIMRERLRWLGHVLCMKHDTDERRIKEDDFITFIQHIFKEFKKVNEPCKSMDGNLL